MSGTELIKAGAAEKSLKKESPNLFSVWDVPTLFMAFLLARAVPFGGIAPFGLAFLAMERKISLRSLLIFVATGIGYLTLGDLRTAATYIGASVLYLGVLGIMGRDKPLSLFSSGCAAGGALLAAGIGFAFWYGFSIGDIILRICDVLIMAMGVIVFDKSREMILEKKLQTQIPVFEEKLSLCIMIGIVLLSFKNIPIVEGFQFANVLGLTLLGIFAVGGGLTVGAVSGIAIGFILGMGDDVLTCLSVFGVCGIAAGIGGKWGKYGASGALLISGFLMTAYAQSLGYTAVSFYEIPIGAVVVAVLPPAVFQFAKKITDYSKTKAEGDDKFKSYVQDKLQIAAQSFRMLSDTFTDIADKQNNVDMSDIALMFDTAADRVCRSCSKVNDCWGKNFNDTYKTMFKLLEIMEIQGGITEDDVNQYLSTRCIHLKPLVTELNRQFEIYKINRIWKTRLCESRELVGEQFLGIAQIMEGISQDIDNEVVFDTLGAEEVKSRLTSQGVEVKEIEVMQDKDGKYSVKLKINQMPGENACEEIIEPTLKAVLGVSMVAHQYEYNDDISSQILHFDQIEGFTVHAGFASSGLQEECGDSHVLHYLNCGKFVATLSDGMGTGHKASLESETIVNLLGDFLEAGFDKDVAVKLVNSVMFMKSANEAFATVDLCIIDLYTGEVEFIKNGAEPSYLKGKAGTETVRATSLPVGILSTVDIESFARKMESGDRVVMVSDGIETKDGKDGWIRQMVEMGSEKLSPQKLADTIMEKSIALKGAADDDMTVIVLEIAER